MAAATGVLGLLAACGDGGPSFGAPRGATRQGRDIFRLWQGSMWAAIAVGGFVAGLILFTLVRFRRRSDALPPQEAENVPLEVLYTAVPLAIVAVLFAYTVATQVRVDRLVARPALTVEVTGFQWQWRFHYPASGITVVGTRDTDPVMVVPVGSTVRLVIQSSDVIHSFYVPDFLFKRDALPGIRNEVDLEVQRAGRFVGHCAEFCGLRHDKMEFAVEAVSPAAFQQWLVAKSTR